MTDVIPEFPGRGKVSTGLPDVLAMVLPLSFSFSTFIKLSGDSN